MKRSVSCFNLRAAAGSDAESDAEETNEVGRTADDGPRALSSGIEYSSGDCE